MNNSVTDYPVSGPTDECIRAADCWWVNNVLRKGASMNAFSDWGLAGPEIFFAKLTPEQGAWVYAALTAVGAARKIDPPNQGAAVCAGSATIEDMTRCFQYGYNRDIVATPAKPLRTDGVFDEDTLCALQLYSSKVTAVPFPDPNKLYCQPPCPTGQARDPMTGLCADQKKPGLSTGAVIGIATAGAVVVGGLLYAAMRK